jgi:hypothetical protein
MGDSGIVSFQPVSWFDCFLPAAFETSGGTGDGLKAERGRATYTGGFCEAGK